MDKFITGYLLISVHVGYVCVQRTGLEPSHTEEKYWMRTAACCESFSHSPCVEFTVNVTINNPSYISNVQEGELEKSDKNFLWYVIEGEEGKQPHTGANKQTCVTFHLFYLNHDIHLTGTCQWTFTWELNDKEQTCVGTNTGSTSAARTPRATDSVHHTSNTDSNTAGTETSRFSAFTGGVHTTTTKSTTILTTQSILTNTTELTSQSPTNNVTSYPPTSSTSTSTTASVNSSASCLCRCGCREKTNMTKMENKMEQIIAELVVPKNSTSQTKRKLTSATDSRPSSRGIGAVGVVVITTVLALVVVVDARLFVWSLVTKLCNFRSGK